MSFSLKMKQIIHNIHYFRFFKDEKQDKEDLIQDEYI